MNRKLTLALVMVLGLALCGPVLARGESPSRGFPGKWWRMTEFSEQMALSQEEVKLLDRLYLESHARLIDLRAARSKAKLLLDDLLERDALDEKAVYEQLEAVNQGLAATNKERFRFLVEVRKLLGAERYAKLKSLFGRHWRDRKRDGDGGPPPEPPQD